MEKEVLFEDGTPSPEVMALSVKFPDLAFQEIDENRYRLTLADVNGPIWVEYWKVEGVKNGDDPWRYQLSHTTSKTEFRGPFSHPTEQGCWIMAQKYFVENDYLLIPCDNWHLSPLTMRIAQQAQAFRDARAAIQHPTPETGDIVIDENGAERRVCLARAEKCQTTTAMERSYFIGENGIGSYSGSLGQSINFADMTETPDTRPVLFWTFRDGRAGAGRAVEFWVTVTVWRFAGQFGNGLWGKG